MVTASTLFRVTVGAEVMSVSALISRVSAPVPPLTVSSEVRVVVVSPTSGAFTRPTKVSLPAVPFRVSMPMVRFWVVPVSARPTWVTVLTVVARAAGAVAVARVASVLTPDSHTLAALFALVPV